MSKNQHNDEEMYTVRLYQYVKQQFEALATEEENGDEISVCLNDGRGSGEVDSYPDI
ncbi:MAG: hypothetical protein WDZ76_05340 [Pseudohongiellaceae bacterium]